MKKIISFITALAFCLSLCTNWTYAGALTYDPDEGYAWLELQDVPADKWDTDLCTHGEPVDECRVCTIEDLLAALPRRVTANNRSQVKAQLQEILALYTQLSEDEQDQLDLTPCYELQAALDTSNAPMGIDSTTQETENDEGTSSEEETGSPLITEQPKNVELYYDYTTESTLSVTTTGEGVTYQWYEKNTAIKDATQATYTVPTGKPVGTYEYYCVVASNGYTEQSKTATVTVSKSGTNLEGNIKTYNGEDESDTFIVSDTITVKATPTVTGQAPDNAETVAANFVEPSEGQMALFVGDTQVSKAVSAGADGIYIMTASASDVLTLGQVEPTDNAITLTAKFVGNNDMADAVATVEVKISVVKVEIDSDTTYYGTIDAAWAAAKNTPATVTLLHNVNVTASDALTVSEGDNITFDGGSYSLGRDVTVNGGKLSITGGTFNGKISCNNNQTVGSLLLNHDNNAPDALHYAYYKDNEPLTNELNETTLTGPVTVGVCKHDADNIVQYQHIDSTQTHKLACLACGYTKAEADCSYGTEYGHSETEHWLTCTVCQGTTTPEAHDLRVTAGEPVNGVTQNHEACDQCGFIKNSFTVTVTVPSDLTYGNTVGIKPSFTVSTEKNYNAVQLALEDVEGNVEYMTGDTLPDNLSAGRYKLYLSGAVLDNPEPVFKGRAYFTVAPAPITEEMVTLSPESVTYSGTEQKPTITVKQGETMLEEGTDYDVTYSSSNFTNAETITVTITGKGNYTGTVETTYTIAQATPTIAWSNTSQQLTYTGNPAVITKPEVTLVNGDTLSDKINYSYAVGDSTSYTPGLPTNAGTYNIKASIDAEGNYAAAISTNTLNLTITKSTPNIVFASSYSPDKTYDGETISDPTASDLEITGASYDDVKFEWSDTPLNVETYTLTASIPETTNTAKAEATLTVTISPKTVTADSSNITLTPSEYEFNGTAREPAVVIKDGTLTIPAEEYTVGYSDNTNVGEATVTITDKDGGNYTVNGSTTFQITKRSLSNATVTVSGTYTYNGEEQIPAVENVSVVLNGATIAPSEYTISATSNNINAGEAATVTITATEDGDYSGIASGKFTIAPAPLTIKAKDQSIAFGQSIAKGTDQVTATGLCTDDSLDSITLVASSDQVTEENKTIRASDAKIKKGSDQDVTGNYQITYEEGKLTITTVEVTLTFNDQEITYGEKPAPATVSPASAQIEYSYTTSAGGESISGWPTNAGTYIVTAEVKANDNYGAASKTAKLTIDPKTVSASVAAEPGIYVYTGEAIIPTKIVVKDENTVIPDNEYTAAYSNNTNVGTANVTITDKDGGNYIVSGSTTFTITAKPLDGAAVNVSGTFVYSGNEHTPDPVVTLDGRTLTKDTDYTVSYAGNVNAGTATVTITGNGNYSDTANGTFTISKATLTADGNGIAKGTYGETLSELTVEGPTAKFNGSEVPGTWKLTGDTIPDVDDKGEYTATFTPDNGAGNYAPLTVQVTLEIAKANHADDVANTSCKYGRTQTYDMANLLPKGYTLGTVTISDSNGIFDGMPALNGTALTYKLADNANNVDKTGTITVPVTSSTNYNEYKLTITVTVTNVQVPELTVNPIQVTYNGKPVPNSSISGTAAVDGQTVTGKWSFAEGQNITNVTDSGTKQVIFTPDNTELYDPNTGAVIVTISKATPSLTLTPSPAALTNSGTVTLTLSGLPAGGSATATCDQDGIRVVKGTGNVWTVELPNRTAVYTFTASFAGDDNYNAVSASCTVTTEETVTPPAPSTSSTPSTPSAGDDDTKMELVVETGITKVPDSLANKPELNTPEKLETAMKTELSKVNSDIPAKNTIVYDVKLMVSMDGGSTWVPATKDNFPSKGLTVTLPYPEGTNSSYRFTVVHMFTTSDFGKQPGDTEVFTPEQVKNTANGLQVVVTGLSPISVGWEKANGSDVPTTPTKPSTPSSSESSSNNGGSSKPSIIPVDRPPVQSSNTDSTSQGYTDLGGAGTWYYDAVNFVLRNGLMKGYSKRLFGPDDNLTRAQLAQILYNNEGKPVVTGGKAFTDVTNGQWFAPAITWASVNGIVSGYGKGRFGPNDNITREQLAVMLWRYAGSPAATNKELHFADADKASRYALEALLWASENGILNGYGNGVLNPGGLATRAQVAQMLKNFMEN